MPLPLHCTFVLTGVALALSTVYSLSYARDEFNLRILELDSPLENTKVLEEFINNNNLTPGVYLTSVMWGQEYLDKRNITFILSSDKKKLIPRFTKADLGELGLNVGAIPALQVMDDDAEVGDISQIIDGARYDFQLDSQTLRLQIPQIYQNSRAIGSISPKYRNDGDSAAWLSYYASGSQQNSDGDNLNSNWLNLNSGVNLGVWRLRNNTVYSGSNWDSISTSLQRDIKILRSQMEVGQTFTNGELFDSVQMTGIKLETDTSMLPESEQGFAPVVRGIANSDAQVVIKQNGYVIYQTWVSAGPFEIKDLNQVTAGADLDVTIKETNGQEHSFIQASSAVPILQRENALKYSVAAGKYRDSDNKSEQPVFGVATAIYGLPYGITIYGGILGASMYRSGVTGIGADLGRLGSVSIDITAANTKLEEHNDATGLSWRAMYSKDFPDTDTTLNLASYRYSTSQFYTFQEALDQRDIPDDKSIYSYRQTNNRRNRLQINLSQNIGRWGSIYLNGYQQDYWGMQGSERSIGMGYSTSWSDISWSVNYALTDMPGMAGEQQFSLSINIPLSRWLPGAWATYNANRSDKGNTSHQMGIAGTALQDNNLSYNLQQTYADNNVGYGASINGRYRSSVGEFGLGYNYDKNSRQWNYSAQGAVVAHTHGVTLGQSVQDSFAIVHIDDGANVKVQNAQGVYTDYWGNAIIPNMTNYRHNTITVNTQGHDNLDIVDATQDVIPSKGAVIGVNFKARNGMRALLTLLHDKEYVPFGSLLTLGDSTSIVGEDGEVYITGVQNAMSFTVQWGKENNQQCTGIIAVPETYTKGIYKATIECR
ncbi:fimbrial biogenesis outer membrane usher protein [Escherichia coli]|nr:fimbrial biogenesis outer membrane usher protein [Escherichia coli]